MATSVCPRFGGGGGGPWRGRMGVGWLETGMVTRLGLVKVRRSAVRTAGRLETATAWPCLFHPMPRFGAGPTVHGRKVSWRWQHLLGLAWPSLLHPSLPFHLKVWWWWWPTERCGRLFGADDVNCPIRPFVPSRIWWWSMAQRCGRLETTTTRTTSSWLGLVSVLIHLSVPFHLKVWWWWWWSMAQRCGWRQQRRGHQLLGLAFSGPSVHLCLHVKVRLAG
ncbi:hypothetical protein ml_511 [Mollivirus sibericum]|uniref:hypothetical protein n=1 Tax=Mollivirus sibericum TaxID=1678078 RepID=UPI0006B2EEF5|nr:hypothetical protein ml_511 [Mollivirus sibericum]ALD62313.1 hypothetical protein ml_511 [Mollivirus sibericum]